MGIIFAVAFGVPGLVVAVVGVVVLLRARAGTTGATRIQGWVSGHGHYVSEGRDLYYPKYSAKLPDGRVVHGSGSMAMSSAPANLGMAVSLVFNPNNVDAPLSEPGMNPAYLIGGLVCIGVGGLLLALALVLGIGSLAG